MRNLFDGFHDDNTDPREGEYLRDEALRRFRRRRPELVRRIQREFVRHLLDHGPATSDAARTSVPIPRGVDPRVVGSAVRGLAEVKLITSVGRRKSRRPAAHARKIDLWAIRDPDTAREWLDTHPELDPPDGPETPSPVPA